jgi:methyl-accepting chemotaxis protein
MKNMTIGTRLGLGFAAILGLMLVIAAIGVGRLQAVGNLNDTMVNDALVKERLVITFYRSIELNVGRIVAAAKNPDVEQQKFYKQEIGATISKNNELVKRMEELITDDAGRAALAEIDRREGYEVRLLAALISCTRPIKG